MPLLFFLHFAILKYGEFSLHSGELNLKNEDHSTFNYHHFSLNYFK
jgi:hypothetical protein